LQVPQFAQNAGENYRMSQNNPTFSYNDNLNHSVEIKSKQKRMNIMKNIILCQMGHALKDENINPKFKKMEWKFEYYENPERLQKIFNNNNNPSKLQRVNTEDSEDITYSGPCSKCGSELVPGWFVQGKVKGLFFANNPLCIECKRSY